MVKWMCNLTATGVMIMTIISGQAAEYFVDAVSGNDSNSGLAPAKAWQSIGQVNRADLKPDDTVRFKAGNIWRESLICQSGAEGQPVTYTGYGEGAKPALQASVDLSSPDCWVSEGENIWKTRKDSIIGAELVEYESLGLNADVGNIILIKKGQREKIAGWKRWSINSLTQQGDFFHDPADNRLCFYSDGNPANTYSQIEAALKRGIVRFQNTTHVVVDGLTIAYTGAHGANGSNCRHGTIRNCNFLWIGGSLLYTRNGNPTRYGNGVEFWNGCEDMTVENNYFENIYDTAMTNQGRGDGLVRNMIWRNNKIVRCEQSYEIWFSNPEMQVDGLFFAGNECIDSGYGWGHVQRPTAAGCHLLAYSLKCKIKDIHYEHNIFNNARDAQIWFHNPRLNEISVNHNTYIQRCAAPKEAKLFRWYGAEKEGVSFDAYRAATGNDHDSTLAN